MLLLSTYVALLVFEAWLSAIPRSRSDLFTLSLRGMAFADPEYSYHPTSGWSGDYFDGVVHAEIQFNSLGQRDDEPDDPTRVESDVLLLGDSFAFGMGLERKDNIEARIEATSGGAVTAYNVGLPGWGAFQSRLQLERLPWHGRAVVYLYFVNDVTWGNVVPGAMTFRRGLLTPRVLPNGTELTDEYLDAQIDRVLAAEPGMGIRPWMVSCLKLTRISVLIEGLRDPQLRTTGFRGHEFKPELTARWLEEVDKMQRLADERSLPLFVVLIPAEGEVAGKAWSPANEDVLAAMEDAGIEAHTELLTRLSPDDYLPHDGHFGPGGAQVTADYVLELVGD